jgi:RHS repeat-associated protein
LIVADENWTLGDHLNSIRDVIDARGKVTGHREYNAFGKITRSTGKVECIFGYTGKIFDNQTQLQWNINRWYDANVGRWISEDPIGFKGRSVNIVRYVNNLPTTKVDHYGYVSWVSWCLDFVEDVVAGLVANTAYNNFCTQCLQSQSTCDSCPPQPIPMLPSDLEDSSKYCYEGGVPYSKGSAIKKVVSSKCTRVCTRTSWAHLPCCDSSGTFIREAWYVCKNTTWLWGTDLRWKFDRWDAFVPNGECNACACGSSCTDNGFTYNNPPA